MSLNFNKEEFNQPEEIIEKINGYANLLESNFINGVQYKSYFTKQPKASYIAVKDIQNNRDSSKILTAFFENMKIEQNNKEHKNEFSGIYLFVEKNNEEFKFLYTGISRKAISRIKGHINKGDKSTATLASIIAKKENPKLEISLEKYSYKTLVSKEMKDDKKNLIKQLNEEILKVQAEKFSKYYLTFIPVENNFLMHIAEGYVACKLKCFWNSFKTH